MICGLHISVLSVSQYLGDFLEVFLQLISNLILSMWFFLFCRTLIFLNETCFMAPNRVYSGEYCVSTSTQSARIPCISSGGLLYKHPLGHSGWQVTVLCPSSFFSVTNWGRSVDIADRHREFVPFSLQFYQFPSHSFEAVIRCICVRTVTHSWWLSSLLLRSHLYPEDLCSETYPDMDTATPSSFWLYLFPSFTFDFLCLYI